MSPTRVSVILLTKNEEALVGRCIRSVLPFADEVVVVDSQSTDDTVAVALGLGAKVVVQPWLGWLGQKGVALDACANDWVFSIDADEIVSPELAASILKMKETVPDPDDGFVLQRLDEFLGRIMPDMRRPSQRDSFVRLFNRRRSGWDPEVPIHEIVRCKGTLHRLEGPLIHWRNYTVGRQMETMNRYSDIEAQVLVRSGRRPVMLFAKPVLRFLWIYLARGSWRMGTRGFLWAGLHAGAEFLRHAKAWEIENAPATPHPPTDVVELSGIESPEPA